MYTEAAFSCALMTLNISTNAALKIKYKFVYKIIFEITKFFNNSIYCYLCGNFDLQSKYIASSTYRNEI